MRGAAARRRERGLLALLALLLLCSLAGCSGSHEQPSATQTPSTVAAETPASGPVEDTSTPPPSPEPTASSTPLAEPAIVEVIDLGGPAVAGHNPRELAISGDAVYVANEGSLNLSIVRDGAVALVIALGEGPYRLASDPVGGRVYVAAEASRLIYVVRNDEIDVMWRLDQAPTAMALNGTVLWVGYADGSLQLLDTQTGHVIDAIAPGDDGMIVDLYALEDGRVAAATYTRVHLYAADGGALTSSQPYPGYRAGATAYGDLFVCAYDQASAQTRVVRLSGADLAPIASWLVADDALGLAVDSDSEVLYVSGTLSNHVRALDMASGDGLSSAVVGLSPQHLQYDQASGTLYATCYESDALVALAGNDLAVRRVVPLALRVTSLAATDDALYVGLNTGGVREITSDGQSDVVTGIGYPSALAVLPDHRGLAILDRAAHEVRLISPEDETIASVPTQASARSLFYDATADALYAGDVLIDLATGEATPWSIEAEGVELSPVQVLKDTTGQTLYAVALNGLAGSNAGYVVYRQEGSAWALDTSARRPGVLDLAYDESTDRLIALTGFMGEYELQVTEAAGGSVLYALPLDTPTSLMLVDAPLGHLWLASEQTVGGGTRAAMVLTAYDANSMSSLAVIPLNDSVGVATASPQSGRLYLASGTRPLIYVLQDVSLAPAAASQAPTVMPVGETTTTAANVTAQPQPSTTPAPTQAATRVPSPTPAPSPTCAIAVLADLLPAGDAPSPARGCPTGAPTRENWGWQPFEHGALYWRRDTRQILVAYDDGTLLTVGDQWAEGMADQACQAKAPAGLWQPIRGFGLVWCSEPGVRDQLGWALQPEETFMSTYQLFTDGLLFAGEGQGVIWVDYAGRFERSSP